MTKILVLFTFMLLGITSLTWAVTVSANFDFFLYFQKEYNPDFIFQVLQYALNVIFQIVMIFLGERFENPKIVVLFALYLHLIAFIAIPFVAFLSTPLVGFIICCLLNLFVGLGNAMLLKAAFGLVTLFPKKYSIAISTGQGFVGILVNIAKILALLAIGEPEKYPVEEKRNKYILLSLILFGFSALLIVLTTVLTHMLFENEYFKSHFHSSDENIDILQTINKQSLGEKDQIESKYDQTETEIDEIEEIGEENNAEAVSKYYVSFFKMTFKILDMNIMMFTTYFISFSMFPALSIKCKNIFDLEKNFTIIIMLFNYNIFETLGRYTPTIIDIAKIPLMMVVTLRLIFFFTFPVIFVSGILDISNFLNSEIFIISNMAFFAYSHGFITSSILAHAPAKEEFSKKEKGLVATNLIFFLIFGLFCGSLNAALQYTNIL